MENKLEALLEVYTVSEILQMMDITEIEAMEILLDPLYGVIKWEELEDEIQLPINCLDLNFVSNEEEINEESD